MMKKCLLLLFLLLSLPLMARKMPSGMLEDIRRARSMGFDVRHVEGTNDISDVAMTLHSFVEAAEYFPKDFFRKGGLRCLFIQERRLMTSIDGEFTAGGFARGNTMILPTGCEVNRGVIAHEMYHIFDKRGRNDREWGELNHRDFIYKGHGATMNFNYTEKERKRYIKRALNSQKKYGKARIERNLGKKIVRQIALNDANPEIQAGFVTKYAQTNQLEDRAETFKEMYLEQEGFLARVKDSPVLKKKMEFIREETKEWLGRHYWSMVDEYGTNPKFFILSSPPEYYTNSWSHILPCVEISRTILNENSLVQYKAYKGQIQPCKPIEKILKRLRSDIEMALRFPESKTYSARKNEAFYIAKSVKKYKERLVALSNKLKKRGDIEGVKKAVRILVCMYPSRKEEWLEMFGIDFE